MSDVSKSVKCAAIGVVSSGGVPLRVMAGGIALVTLLLFLPAYWYDFIYLDDYEYVIANPQVQDGPTWSAIKWAFTTGHASNWHPLTWVSHMVDCRLFGLDPGPHHLVNVLLHVGNAVLVFLLWERLTGRRGTAFFIAALFAWHPLRLESVVWIAERKDVLSAFFGLGALLSYVIYAQARRTEVAGAQAASRCYWLALGLFALGLLAKPMLVTLPCVMLLLDFWPLERWAKPWQVIREKLPFLLFSALSCVVTVWVQRQEAVVPLENLSLSARLANVLIAYVRYLGKALYPVDLAIFYPLPPEYPTGLVAGAAAVLVGISFWVWQERRRQPWCLMGWCWYLGMLVPVIGLVQVGWQAGADRYTYWPVIGLVAAVVLLVSQWLEQCPRRKGPVVGGGVIALLACVWLTTMQLPYWRNAETLGARAIEVTKTNIVAHQIRGKFYYDQGRRSDALLEFRQALQIGENHAPTATLATNNLAFRLVLAADFQQQGQLTEALAEYERVLSLLPGSAPAHNDLGNLLSDMGHKAEALVHYQAAIKLAPRAVESYNNMAITLAELGRFSEALAAHTKAIELAPGAARSYYLTGKTHLRMGQDAEAIHYFRQALTIAPQDYQSLTMLARILASAPEASLRNGAEAVALAQRAAELTGQQQPLVLDVLAMAQAEQGNFAAAQQTIAQAITLASEAQATNLIAELQIHAAAFVGQQPWRHTNAAPVQAQP